MRKRRIIADRPLAFRFDIVVEAALKELSQQTGVPQVQIIEDALKGLHEFKAVYRTLSQQGDHTFQQ